VSLVFKTLQVLVTQGDIVWRTKFRDCYREAEYHCRYNWRDHKVKDIQDGVFYPTRFASPQSSLIPLNPQEALVLYRPKPMMRQVQLPFPAQQLWLFELVHTA